MKTAEEILKRIIIDECTDSYEENFEFYEESVIKAMEEYASQFKTVEPEKRAELLKEIMDTDQEHGMYETENKCDHLSVLWINGDWKYFCLECGKSKITF